MGLDFGLVRKKRGLSFREREREIGENRESVFFFIYGTVGRLGNENMWMTLFVYFLLFVLCTAHINYNNVVGSDPKY